MKYVIVSPKVGTPGEEFVAPDGVNVEALLENGFIASADKPASKRKITSEQE